MFMFSSFSSGSLRSAEYPFIIIDIRSTQIRTDSTFLGSHLWIKLVCLQTREVK